MKTLNFEQMENVKGGATCGKIGAFFGVAAGILMVAALATNPITLAGGLILAHSISFGIAGSGCAMAELIS